MEREDLKEKKNEWEQFYREYNIRTLFPNPERLSVQRVQRERASLLLYRRQPSNENESDGESQRHCSVTKRRAQLARLSAGYRIKRLIYILLLRAQSLYNLYYIPSGIRV